MRFLNVNFKALAFVLLIHHQLSFGACESVKSQEGAGSNANDNSEEPILPSDIPEEEEDDIPILDVEEDVDEGVSLDEIEIKLMKQKLKMLEEMKRKLEQKVVAAGKIGQEDLICKFQALNQTFKEQSQDMTALGQH